MMQRYWVTYIGIDITGMGAGVAQIVKTFFPNLVTFSYSPEVKTRPGGDPPTRAGGGKSGVVDGLRYGY